MDKAERKERNAELLLELTQKFMKNARYPEEIAIARARIEMEYDRLRERSPKEAAKEEKKKEKERAKQLDEARKGRNAEIKKTTSGKEYAEKKEYSAKDKQKAEDRNARAVAREYNAGIREVALAALDEDADKEDRQQAKASAAKAMFVVDEKTRKEKNAALKKYLSRAEYREHKVHRTEIPDGGGGKNAFKDPKEIIDMALGAASGGNAAVAGGARVFGDDATKDQLIGAKHEVEGADGEAFSVKSGGATEAASGIINGVGGVTDIVNSAMGLAAAVQNRSDPDPSVRALATREVVGNAQGLAKGGVKTASGVLTAIKGFSDNEQLAESIQLDAIPVLGIVGTAASWLDNAVKAEMACARAGAMISLLERVKADDNEQLEAAFTNLAGADVRLIADKSFDLLQNSATLVQHTLTLSGIGAPIAAGIKLTNTIVSGVRGVANVIWQSEKAARAQRAQVKFHDALDGGSSNGHVARRGKKLLERDAKYAVQEMINQARDGNNEALDYLNTMGMGTADLSQVSDRNLRKFVLKTIEEDEEGQTIKQQINGLGDAGRGFRRKVIEKFGKGVK